MTSTVPPRGDGWPRPHPSARRAIVEALSTDGLVGAKRIEFWNDVVCNTFTPLTVDVPSADIRARMRRLDLGDVRFAIAESTQANVSHSREQVNRCPDAYFLLHLQLAGDSVNQQTGREVVLHPGDLTLVDSSRPYRVSFDYPTSMLVIRMPRTLLREYVACPESLTVLPISGTHAPSRLAARFMRDLWRRLPEAAIAGAERHLTDALMSVIAAACATLPRATVEGSTQATVLRIRLVEFIEANLGDPDLDPATIAQKGRISLRYLHMLFQEQGESVWRYVQRRRLEECARVLRDPLHAASNVTQIACAHGFKGSSHFCRAFRERYGMTPTDFRAANLRIHS